MRCKETGKHIYSEASATRAKYKYEDIKRIYRCDYCEGWHTTSMGVGLMKQEGLIHKVKKQIKPKKNVTPSEITKRLKQLNENN